MPEKGHWPFSNDADERAARGSDRTQSIERERARIAEQAVRRQHLRHDRLIVGGRAHTKKSGLS